VFSNRFGDNGILEMKFERFKSAPRITKIMNTAYLIGFLVVAVSLMIFPFVLYLGDQVMVVTSDSMLPTLKPNDMIVVRSATIDEISTGDIIAFHSNYEDIGIVAHRVFKISADHGSIAIVTKGDNVPDIDDWIVTEENLIGKVVSYIPNVGIFLKEPVRYAIIAFIVILSVGLIWKLYSEGKIIKKT